MKNNYLLTIKKVLLSLSRTHSKKYTAAGLFVCFFLLGTVQPVLADTFTVSNTNDAGAGSLRQAILDANASILPAPHIIGFSVSGTITLASGLPSLENDGTIVDGYTAPGAVPGPIGSRALTVIISGGDDIAVGHCFTVAASNITICGLVINNTSLQEPSSVAISINASSPSGMTNCWIWGNHILSNAAGSAISGKGNGIWINAGVTGATSTVINTIIGTDGDGNNDGNEGNIIGGGNGYSAILVQGADNTRIAGNYIGIDAAGNTALEPLADFGVQLENCYQSLIGTNGDGISDVLERNVIGGMASCNIAIVYNSAGDNFQGPARDPGNNTVAGNYIGANAAGNAAVANNRGYGVIIWDASGNTIGSLTGNAIFRNVIAGNSNHSGVYIYGQSFTSSNNIIANNYIGVGADGITPIANGFAGVQVNGGSNNIILQNNIANNGTGVIIRGDDFLSTNNTISKNTIYDNGGLGIDIYNNSGVTPNDGALDTPSLTAPNELVDYPIITQASLSSGNLNVKGFVGDASGSSAFAGMTLEFFVADNSPANQDGPVSVSNSTSAPHGEGKTYISSGTTDANGNFDITFSGTGLIDPITITATVTTATGSTSEFGPTVTVPLNIALPVTLASFTANAENGKARLDWATAAEQNNIGFELQRSSDSRNWEMISFVNTKAENGNSSHRLDYIAYDNRPGAGINYYRLKQTDKDGKYAFSEVREVSFGAENVISIYPNPVADRINISLSDWTKVKEVRLLSMEGKVIYKSYGARDGIDMKGFAQGNYLLQIEFASGNTSSFKVVKR